MSRVVRTLSRCLLPSEASRDPGGSKEVSRRERDAAQEREARRRSREIDAMLARERRSVRRLVKILLLGAGESGKSTFLKQMRIINGQEFGKKALLDFRDTIYENILKVRRRPGKVLPAVQSLTTRLMNSCFCLLVFLLLNLLVFGFCKYFIQELRLFHFLNWYFILLDVKKQ